MRSLVDHRFDRENVSHLDLRPQSRPAIVRDLRVFVHPAANSMADIVPHNGIAVSLRVLLHRPTNVAEVISSVTFLDRPFETLFSYANQFELFVVDFADRDRRGRVAYEPLERY